MMPDRRTFLITCSGVVASPALAQFRLPWTGGGLPAALPAAPLPLTLKIDGWDAPADSETDVWLQINSSWRANWR